SWRPSFRFGDPITYLGRDAQAMKKKRLGEVLRERGQVSPADLNKAIEDQQGKLVHLGELMLERGVVSKTDLASALTEITHVPYVDCESIEIDPDVLKLL